MFVFKTPWCKFSRLLLEVSMYCFSTSLHYMGGLHKYIIVPKHIPELFRRWCNTKCTLPTRSSWSEERSKSSLIARQVLLRIHNIVAQFCIHLESAPWDIFFMGWNNINSHTYESNWSPSFNFRTDSSMARKQLVLTSKSYEQHKTVFMVLAENNIHKCRPHASFHNSVGKWLAHVS